MPVGMADSGPVSISALFDEESMLDLKLGNWSLIPSSASHCGMWASHLSIESQFLIYKMEIVLTALSPVSSKITSL